MTSFVFKPKETPPDSDDSQAADEAISFADGRDLEREAAKNNHDRNESFREYFRKAILILFVFFVVLVVVTVSIWAFHLLTPDCWHWLSPAQQEKLQVMVFTFAAASGVQSFAKKHTS